MKWYIGYPIVWIIVFLAYFAFMTSQEQPLGLRIILALIMGTILSAVGYAGYEAVTKKKK